MNWDFVALASLFVIIAIMWLAEMSQSSKERRARYKLLDELGKKGSELERAKRKIEDLTRGRLFYLRTWDGVYYEVRARKLRLGYEMPEKGATVHEWEECSCEQSCAIACKHADSLHFHHDGCPACGEVQE